MVSLNRYQGSGSFKSYPTLNSDNGIPYVNIAPNTIRPCKGFQLLDVGHRAIVFPIEGNQFPFLKSEDYFL